MSEIEDNLDEQDLSQERERRQWKVIEDLNRKYRLENVAKHRCTTEHLRVPNSLDTWKSWLVNEALARTWVGIQQAAASNVLTAAAMVLAVAQLDECGIVCSPTLPAFPAFLFTPLPIDALSAKGARKSMPDFEDKARSSLETLRAMCYLSDAIVRARERESDLPVPATLADWIPWLVREATGNIVLAATEHGNPTNNWGSAWLFRVSSQELAGVARLYELGVQPRMTYSPFPLLTYKQGHIQ